mmetsp:Transcript_5501/g.15540  ORF Transcript_5501/g.15540 Transcript_5501/m.15540 type:complete len:83 (+) Transcript_5501:69-317(+)
MYLIRSTLEDRRESIRRAQSINPTRSINSTRSINGCVVASSVQACTKRSVRQRAVDRIQLIKQTDVQRDVHVRITGCIHGGF